MRWRSNYNWNNLRVPRAGPLQLKTLEIHESLMLVRGALRSPRHAETTEQRVNRTSLLLDYPRDWHCYVLKFFHTTNTCSTLSFTSISRTKSRALMHYESIYRVQYRTFDSAYVCMCLCGYVAMWSPLFSKRYIFILLRETRSFAADSSNEWSANT